ncbi:MAG: hypothetical protein LBH76_07850 [Propionibacteriaceae bacterium]|jgi:hypothetical protein|nr:hypothetical protein [Propionibacteriaceae bacterium]
MGKRLRLPKRVDWTTVVFLFVLVSLVAAVSYSIACIATSPSGAVPDAPYGKTKSDYTLMLVQCLLGIAVIFLPSVLEKQLKLSIPKSILIAYSLFLYCSIILGEVQSFYYRVPFWDTVLHAFSGAMLGLVGVIVIASLNEQDKIRVNLNSAFVSVFAFCFALTVGALWEVYEFTFDGLLGLNMQKHLLESGEPLTGREALGDTMKDLIVDAMSAFAVIFGYHFRNRAKAIPSLAGEPAA